MALITPGVIDDGHTDTSLPLDDRPWECFDHMIPLPPRPPHNVRFLASRPLRDTGSMSLALFNPKLKRETLPEDDTSSLETAEGEVEPDTKWGDYASERNLGDGLAGEPIAAKQIATRLFAGPDEATVENEIMVNKSAAPLPELEAAMAAGTDASAISSTQTPRLRRMSTRLAQTQSQTSGSNRDPITIDDGEEAGETSDDIEEVDGPTAKRAKTTSASALASSRPTTGGKAMARKTVGGKSMARKGVGGKSVRKTTGGKGPRTGRRKSIVE